MSQTNYLETEKVSKLLLKFSIPCILSLLIAALYNIVDQIFIGNSNVGAIGNTATTIVFPITVIALGIGLMLGDGAAALMSLLNGEGEGNKNHKIVGSNIIASVVISLVFVAICAPLLKQILTLFGARTEEALEKSLEYGKIILIGIPFYIILTSLNSIIRADGSPQVAMISTILGAVINIILDAALIMGAKLGLKGAALATISGQFVAFAISVLYLFKTKTFKLNKESFKFNNHLLNKSLKLGMSSFLTQISIVLGSVISMNVLAEYGKNSKYGINDPQAIFGIVLKVFAIVVNIAVGLTAGAQPIVGHNYGAKKFDRVKSILTHIIVIDVIVGLVFTVLFETIPSQILSIFGSNSANPELYKEFGVLAIRIYLSLIIFTLVQKSTAIYLQATGSPVKAMILSVLRDIVVIILAMIILPILMGQVGVLYSSIVTDIVSIIVTVIFLIKEYKKLNA